MIIGIAGFIGSGKDTLADYLVNFHEFKRESFASSLKDVCSVVFGWDRELLEGRTKEARAWREQVDQWWATRLGMPGLTPRKVLQLMGTEVFRVAFHDDIWIASLERKLLSTKDHVVITDCRFPNEIRAIKANGGMVVRIDRGDQPIHYELGLQANAHIWSGNEALRAEGLKAQQKLIEMGVHPSEWAWIGAPFDCVVDNNGSIQNLYDQAQQLTALNPSKALELA